MAQLLVVGKNPTKKRRRKKSASKASSPKRKSSRKRKASAKSGKRRRAGFRSNPIRIGGGFMRRVIDNQLIPASVQASGAILLDLGFGYFGQYLPAALTSGLARHATKVAGAALLSTVAQHTKLVNSTVANNLAKGAMTVVLHDFGKEMLGQFAPSLPLGYYTASPVVRLAGYRRRSMAAVGNQSTIYNIPGTFPGQLPLTGSQRTGIGAYMPTQLSAFRRSSAI